MNITVRPLSETDRPEATRIFRLAFGTFLGLPDSVPFMGDADLIGTRLRGYPDCSLAAEVDGRLVGSNFVTGWGSVGFFGPLSILPEFWNAGVASALLEATMDVFPRLQTKHAGLFTFPQSSKHLHLYQKFGFWPGDLTPILAKPISPQPSSAPLATFAQLSPTEQTATLAACRDLTSSIHDGLDLSPEINSVASQGLGDTVLRLNGSRVTAFAICHTGPGTEAGSGRCYVKFAAASSAEDFEHLLGACGTFAAARGAHTLEAGVNVGRHQAYRMLLAQGFRFGDLVGVAMHRHNDPAYNHADALVIDDWR